MKKKLLFLLILVMAPLLISAQESSCEVETTATIIKTEDLQKSITENIAKDFAGYTIKEAVCIKSGEVVTYEVVVGNGTITEKLTYDKDGKFVKKVTRKVPAKSAPKKN